MATKLVIIAALLMPMLALALTPVQAQGGQVNPNPNLSMLWAQVGAQPDDFAVACMPINDRARAVLYNATEPFPLASLTKLLVFIEYARRVESGQITLDDMVSVGDLNRYILPGTDRGAHDAFLGLYPPGTTQISLWEVASLGMIQYSSNAASDYVLDYLEPVDWEALYALMNLGGTSPPHPINAIPLMMNNHEIGQSTLADVQTLSVEQGDEWFQQFMQDDDWRAAELAYRQEARRSFPGWDVQAAILQQHTATGTTYDFLNVMLAIYGLGGSLSQNVKRLVRLGLAWDPVRYEFLGNTYAEYGSKLGYYSGGTLTLAAYGNPYSGNPVVSVVFFRKIPRSVYYAMLEEDTIGNIAHWMNLHQCDGLFQALQAVAS